MGACGCVDSVESGQMGWVQRSVSIALGVAVVTAGVGCGLMRRRPAASDGSVGRDMREGRRPMGQVTMVDTERGFVLVRSPLAAQVAAESRLVIRAGEEAGSTAQLKVSPERKRNMIAADILEGPSLRVWRRTGWARWIWGVAVPAGRWPVGAGRTGHWLTTSCRR